MNEATRTLTSVSEQLAHAKTSAIAIGAPQLAVLCVTGGDRQTWLNGLVTCDVAKLRPGEGAYGLAVTQKGRILADLVAIVGEAHVDLVVPAGTADELRAAFDKYLIMEDAELASAPDGTAVTWIDGPRAADVLRAAREAGGGGAPVNRSGLGGALVVAPPEARTAVDAAIDRALRDVGGARGTDEGWKALRIARGVPEFGVDFDGATYPQEVGLEKTAVSFNKGCYLGQEVVCMLEMRGHVKRRLVPMAIASASPPARGAEVTDAAGQKVGEVTSAVARAGGEGALALAMVKRAHAEPGAELRVGASTATVLAPEA